MKKITQILMTCFILALAAMPLQAQTNEQLDEIRDICTDLVVMTSQTQSDANKIIVFTNNGNANQLERSVEDTDNGLEGIVEGLGRLRRIATGIISNQRYDNSNAYRRSSSRLREDLNQNTRLPRAREEVAGDIVPLMEGIKNLSQEIRAEVQQMKNSNN